MIYNIVNNTQIMEYSLQLACFILVGHACHKHLLIYFTGFTNRFDSPFLFSVSACVLNESESKYYLLVARISFSFCAIIATIKQ